MKGPFKHFQLGIDHISGVRTRGEKKTKEMKRREPKSNEGSVRIRKDVGRLPAKGESDVDFTGVLRRFRR